MTHHNKKTIMMFLGITILVILGVVFFYKNNLKENNVDVNASALSQEEKTQNNMEGRDKNTNIDTRKQTVPVQNQANANSAENVKTLSPYEKQLKALETAPLTKADIEEPLYQGSKEQFKVFKIKVTPDGYVPNAIIVEKGDSVQLNVLTDKDTDIESADFKLFSPISAGKITNLGFLLSQEGTFAFYCRNLCLGKDRIYGHIVVRPRS